MKDPLAPNSRVSGKLTILLVDDSHSVLEIIGKALENHGHVVLSAVTGTEAVEIFENNRVDLVISDLGMEGMSGWEVSEAIREICQRKGLPKPPLILMTGWGREVEDDDRISRCGVDRVLEKPIKIRSLLNAVHKIVASGTYRRRTTWFSV